MIERASGDDLLLSEAQDQFHLVRIPLGKDGRPGVLSHLQLDRGDSCEILDDGLLLVTGKRDGKTRSVDLIDQEKLSVRLSALLPFTEAADFSIPGSTQVGDLVVLYQSTAKIEKQLLSGGDYDYEVPYVAWSKYDIHVLNTANGGVTSFPGLDSDSLPVVRDLVPLSKKEVLARNHTPPPFGLSPKRREVDNYLYVLDQFFVVDQGKLLIFSLANLEGDKLYYSLDLTDGSRSPNLCTASELAAKYPEELVASKSSLGSNEEKRQVTISGEKYLVERAALLPSGLVVVASRVVETGGLYGGDDERLSWRVIMGVKPAAGPGAESLEHVWTYTPRYKGAIGNLLQDAKGGVVYFPELMEEGWFTTRFKVQGLAAADGKEVAGFPANFEEEGWADRKKKGLRIVGTAADFERNLR